MMSDARKWCIECLGLRVYAYFVQETGTKRYLRAAPKGLYDIDVCKKTNNAVLLLGRKKTARSPSFLRTADPKPMPAALESAAGIFVAWRRTTDCSVTLCYGWCHEDLCQALFHVRMERERRRGCCKRLGEGNVNGKALLNKCQNIRSIKQNTMFCYFEQICTSMVRKIGCKLWPKPSRLSIKSLICLDRIRVRHADATSHYFVRQ